MKKLTQKDWNLKTALLADIKKRGGFANCHAHIDKAFYITKPGLKLSMVDMETKWHMSDKIKKNSSQAEIADRIRCGLDILVDQGVKATVSFMDAYDAVGHKSIDAAVQVNKEYKNKIKFLTITQPLGGLNDPKARALYEEITAKADIAGGLPSKDRPNDNKNFDHLFSIAKNLDKPIHVHIDQENNPRERDTEKLIKYTIKHGYQGRVVAIHAISPSAHPKKYREKIYKQLAAADISVVVCPSAALSMRALDQYQAPVHNSIANVPEMLAAGVTVGLGSDNIADFYQPFVDGDMWTELRMLMEACRYYDFDQLAKIASTNGHKILSIK
ncbi:MAG: amidohydrolase family protein [Candidatus Magasanikbacteria bacterium]|nr:amidohydrolase family protein [Candidatus Magasanikbacteria bacterium]